MRSAYWIYGFLCNLFLFIPAHADQKPLLQPGKQAIYQRVLTTPGCLLSTEIAGSGIEVPAFSRFYVYEHKVNNGEEWIQVGPDSFGHIHGWLNKRCTVEWKMQLTLALTNPIGRSPLLFFRNREDIETILNDKEPEKLFNPLLSKLDKKQVVPQVLAREPEYAIDQQKNFYLLPVLNAEEVFTENGFRVRVLNVASVSKQDHNNEQSNQDNINNVIQVQSDQHLLKDFSAAIVFVIDSTVSMQPYIERTKQAVAKIYQRIEKEKLLGHVKFGLVAFRSNIKAVPKLGYVSKLFADPNQVNNGKDFLQKVSTLKAATVSSSRINEDAFAGIMQALDEIDWTPFGARYIVMITDAGALTGDDPLSSTKLNVAQVRSEANYRGVALNVLHLKTPSGKANHAFAEAQYNDLAFNSLLHKSLYYPIEKGSVANLGKSVDSLASTITDQIKQVYEGESVLNTPPPTNNIDASTISQSTQTQNKSTEEQIASDAKLLSYAMQLAYLGGKKGSKAPPVFKAWISDRDLINQQLPTTEVKVLLTKSELSDLSEIIKKIADAANEGLISPNDMFASLRSIAATMGKDPNQLKQGSATKLGEMGLLGEYIEDLPYLSEVLNLDEETWKSWDGIEQEKFIRRLNVKQHYYQRYNQDVDRWISLAPDSDPRDFVYPIPLENLP